MGKRLDFLCKIFAADWLLNLKHGARSAAWRCSAMLLTGKNHGKDRVNVPLKCCIEYVILRVGVL